MHNKPGYNSLHDDVYSVKCKNYHHENTIFCQPCPIAKVSIAVADSLHHLVGPKQTYSHVYLETTLLTISYLVSVMQVCWVALTCAGIHPHSMAGNVNAGHNKNN